MPWAVATGFVRLMTHPRVLEEPATPATAVAYVDEWFRVPNVIPLNPGRDHLALLRQCLAAAGVGANLATNAHLAALAMEYQAELHSTDTDFSRFPRPLLAQSALRIFRPARPSFRRRPDSRAARPTFV